MIGNIRGTSGSGKSTLVRALAEALGGWTPILAAQDVLKGKRNKPLGYVTKQLDVAIVGRYETDCGGCDTVKTQDEICGRVREFHKHHDHVVFEGLLISHIYGRYRDLARELPPFAMMFLDTPLDVCVERVKARRASKGNTDELDPTNTIQKWHDSRRVFLKAKADGLNPVWLSWDRPLEHLREVMGL